MFWHWHPPPDRGHRWHVDMSGQRLVIINLSELDTATLDDILGIWGLWHDALLHDGGDHLSVRSVLQQAICLAHDHVRDSPLAGQLLPRSAGQLSFTGSSLGQHQVNGEKWYPQFSDPIQVLASTLNIHWPVYWIWEMYNLVRGSEWSTICNSISIFWKTETVLMRDDFLKAWCC